MEQKGQKAPQRVEAQNADAERPATFIFLHGFGDDADGFIDIAHQFQSARKLPHLSWIFPNAPHNHEANSTAWYTPTSFSPIPVGASSSPAEESPEDDEFNEAPESDDEIWTSVAYIEGLIEGELKKGVKLERIVVGGFSQGCAIGFVLGLAGRFKGRLGGVVGLSGYLPRGRRVWDGREELRKERGKKSAGVEGEGGKEMRVFIGHGTKDMLVPMRVFRDARERVRYTVGEGSVDSHEYEGLGHTASGAVFRDMCGFLEKVIPE
ncbi:Alpha/Beta hydrolase protein [Rhexocercosporidium sp. MPI-PUGE-AT-0058]|nr:Alpha/Beta hydrolase protein [Rhexocercosporidium sp. MPI-PUGE-AT-0058]